MNLYSRAALSGFVDKVGRGKFLMSMLRLLSIFRATNIQRINGIKLRVERLGDMSLVISPENKNIHSKLG